MPQSLSLTQMEGGGRAATLFRFAYGEGAEASILKHYQNTCKHIPYVALIVPCTSLCSPYCYHHYSNCTNY